MSNNKNYSKPPQEVQEQLEGITDTVNNLLRPIGSAEIKGWWIWIELDSGVSLNGNQESVLRDMSFFQAKQGRNAGKWYYKHPSAPNFRRRWRYNNSQKPSDKSNKSKSKPKSKPDTSKVLDVSSDALDTPELTERGKLEQELKRWEHMLTIDSGENTINIQKSISDAKSKIVVLDAIEKAEKELDNDEARAENLEQVAEQQEQEESATDYVKAETEKEEPKEKMSLEEAKDILKGLF